MNAIFITAGKSLPAREEHTKSYFLLLTSCPPQRRNNSSAYFSVPYLLYGTIVTPAVVMETFVHSLQRGSADFLNFYLSQF
jgi:hypothetical protein